MNKLDMSKFKSDSKNFSDILGDVTYIADPVQPQDKPKPKLVSQKPSSGSQQETFSGFEIIDSSSKTKTPKDLTPTKQDNSSNLSAKFGKSVISEMVSTPNDVRVSGSDSGRKENSKENNKSSQLNSQSSTPEIHDQDPSSQSEFDEAENTRA